MQCVAAMCPTWAVNADITLTLSHHKWQTYKNLLVFPGKSEMLVARVNEGAVLHAFMHACGITTTACN